MGYRANVERAGVVGATWLALVALLGHGCGEERPRSGEPGGAGGPGGAGEPGGTCVLGGLRGTGGAGGSGGAGGLGAVEPLGPPLFVEEVGECLRRVHALRRDQRAPAGFTVDELLARVGDRRCVQLSWGGPMADFDAYPAAAELTATVELAPDLDRLRWHEVYGVILRNPIGSPPSCRSEIQVDGVMHLSSGDGTFAESWPVTLHAAEAGVADFDIQLAGMPHGGTWRIGYRAPVTEESLLVRGIYTGGIVYASFMYQVRPLSCPNPDNCYSNYLCATFGDY